MSTRLWDALRAQWVWSRESNKVRWVWVVYKNTWKYMKFVRSLGLKQAKIALHDVLNFALPNLGNQIGRWERDWHTDSHIDPSSRKPSDNPKESNYLSNFGIQLGKFSRFFTEESSSKNLQTACPGGAVWKILSNFRIPRYSLTTSTKWLRVSGLSSAQPIADSDAAELKQD